MAQLQPKHFKALELIEEGILSYKDIAAVCGIGLDSFYDLIEGDTTAGDIAALFKAEVDRITARSSVKIKFLYKDTKKIALKLLNDRVKMLQKKKKLSKGDSIELARTMNALAKNAPKVEIGSFSYTKGLSAEDLVNEFRRLSTLARSTLDRTGVPETEEGRPGSLPEGSTGGSRLPPE